jgi:hypothetical protein
MVLLRCLAQALFLISLIGGPALAERLADARVVPSVELEVGLNRSWVSYTGSYHPPGIEAMTRYRGAVNLVYDAQQPVSLVLSAAYDQRGADQDTGGNLDLTYATGGLALRVSNPRHRLQPYVAVGPEIGVPVGASRRSGHVRSPEVDLRLAGAASFGSGFFAGVSYTFGLRPVDAYEATDRPPGWGSAFNRVLGFTVGARL